MKRISKFSYEIIQNYKRKGRIAEAVRRKKIAALGLLPDQRIRAAMNERHRRRINSL